MTAAAAGLWARLSAETALALALLTTTDVWAPRPQVPLSFGVAIGACVGVTLVVLLAGKRPGRGALVRERRRLVVAKGLVLGVGSASEEVLWRWFAIGALAPEIGLLPAYATSTIGFALAHGHPKAVLVHLLTGSAFGGVYLLTGSLIASIATHVAYNLIVLFAVETSRTLRPT